MRKAIYIIMCTLALGLGMASAAAPKAADKPEHKHPDLEKIKAKSTDEASKFYYPKLLAKFMSNDTTMTGEEFQYFYYGTLFQEDYDPYRGPCDPERLENLSPLYYRSNHTRAERDEIMKYAREAIADNPLDLVQLKNLVFVYEQNRKDNLAKIWKNKLNHLLHTIAMSGTGLDPEHAWVVVYPRHEFDFLNLSGVTVQSTEFVEPYYEKATVNRRNDKEPQDYYFDIKDILEQYYLKHPSELE